MTCPDCNGRGTVCYHGPEANCSGYGVPCERCEGTGNVPDVQPADLRRIATDPRQGFVIHDRADSPVTIHLAPNSIIVTDANGAPTLAVPRSPDEAIRAFLAAHAAGDSSALHMLADYLAERGHPDSELVREAASTTPM
jgi:hypothetical protein